MARAVDGIARLDVEVSMVEVPKRLRAIDPSVVETLAENIETNGLLQPIVVLLTKDKRYRLVAGAHRLAAVALLGWPTIPTTVVKATDLQARLLEIDENLFRAELSALERAKFLAARQEAYEALHPETRRGVAGGKARQGSANESISFARETAARLGLNERTIQMWVSLWRALDPEAAERLEPVSGLLTFSELRRFSKWPRDRQRARAKHFVEAGPDGASLLELAGPKTAGGGQDEVFAKLVKAWSRATPKTRQRFLSHIADEEPA